MCLNVKEDCVKFNHGTSYEKFNVTKTFTNFNQLNKLILSFEWHTDSDVNILVDKFYNKMNTFISTSTPPLFLIFLTTNLKNL